jgi:hypothetical protein
MRSERGTSLLIWYSKRHVGSFLWIPRSQDNYNKKLLVLFWSTDKDSFKVLSANAILIFLHSANENVSFQLQSRNHVIWYNIFAKVQYQWWIDIQFMFIYVQWWFMLKSWEWSWPVCLLQVTNMSCTYQCHGYDSNTKRGREINWMHKKFKRPWFTQKGSPRKIISSEMDKRILQKKAK